MLNRGPVSGCSKRQPTVALSSTEAKYITLTLAAKEATWLRLLLTELGFLQPNNQHAKTNVVERNSSASVLLEDDTVREREREQEQPRSEPRSISISNKATSEGRRSNLIANTIPLRGDNQGFIALAYNPVFHSQTMYIDIQHH